MSLKYNQITGEFEVIKDDPNSLLLDLKQCILDTIEKEHLDLGVTYIHISRDNISAHNILSCNRKYDDWKNLFKNIGFNVEDSIMPSEYAHNGQKKTHLLGELRAVDSSIGICLTIFICEWLTTAFSFDIAAPILRIELQYDINKLNQFKVWLYGTNNTENLLTVH